MNPTESRRMISFPGHLLDCLHTRRLTTMTLGSISEELPQQSGQKLKRCSLMLKRSTLFIALYLFVDILKLVLDGFGRTTIVMNVNDTSMIVTSVSAMSKNAMSAIAMNMTVMIMIATHMTATSRVEVDMGDMDTNDMDKTDGATDMDMRTTTISCRITLIQGLWVEYEHIHYSLVQCFRLVTGCHKNGPKNSTGYPQLIPIRITWPTSIRCTLHWKAGLGCFGLKHLIHRDSLL